MARVFVDTNVLFPFSIMDLMLALTGNDADDRQHMAAAVVGQATAIVT